MTDATTFAFLVHPRNDVRADLGRIFPPLGLVPTSVYERALLRHPVRPQVLCSVHAEGRRPPLGHVILVPATPRQLLRGPSDWVHERIDAAVEVAEGLGADLLGLGALTAPVTAGGAALVGRTRLGVTNGNAFTAYATAEAVRRTLRRLPGEPTVALVGATGSVGTALARLLARDGHAGELLLVARSKPRLTALAEELGAIATTSTDLEEVRRADLVVLLTSATDALLGSQHLGHGAVVIDDTQPRNTDPSLVRLRPDVTVIDGGLVATPGLHRQGRWMGLRPGESFACLAETALLALGDRRGDFSTGRPTLDQVDTVAALAREHARLGFGLAAPTSFGRPVSVPGWDVVRSIPRPRRETALDSATAASVGDDATVPRVVLLGCGYTSVWAYRSLRPLLRRGEVDVTIVSPDPAHVFHGFTGEVVSGELPASAQVSDVALACPGARHVPGRAVAVDADARTVTVAPTGPGAAGPLLRLPYDHLVVGIGVTERSSAAGLDAVALPLRALGHTGVLNDRVTAAATAAAACDPTTPRGRAERERLLTAVVVGGGLAGVEAAAALATRLRAAAGPDLHGQAPRVVLVHSGQALAADLADKPSLVRRLTRDLGRLGVEVRTRTRVTATDGTGVLLQPSGTPRAADGAEAPDGRGERLSAGIVVSTTGVRADVPAGVDGLPRDARGRLRTTRTLAVGPGVWAGGDVAAVPSVRGGPCPQNALWAIHHGAHIGRNIARELAGRPARPFRYRGLGRAASLGPGRAVVSLYGVPLTGWVAWLARAGFFLWFFPARRRVPGVVAAWSAFRRYLDGPPAPANAASPVACGVPVVEYR